MLVSVAACGEDDVTPPVDTSTNNNNNNGNNNNNNDNNNANNKPADDFEAWDTEGYHIYVSSTSGVNSNDGLTAEKSVRNIERALEIASEYVGNEKNLPIIISLDEGVYSSSKPLDMISGTANTPIIFTSRNGKAVISGGTKIVRENIKLCTDSWVLDHIQSDDVKENLYEVDLSSYGFSLTTILNNLALPSPKYDVVEFYRGDETLDLARWPNKNEVAPTVGSFDYFTDLVGFEITRYMNYNDENGNFVTVTEASKSALKESGQMNIFLSDETYEAVKDWDFANQDIHTKDFFSNKWDDLIHKVVGFTDVSDNPLHFNGIDFKGYFTTDRGAAGAYEVTPDPVENTNGFRRFAFLNALEAIDLDSEYYYDYDNQKMYVYFEDEASLDDFYIGTNKDVVINFENVSNVSFRNVDIRHSQQYLIHIDHSSNISFIGCTISNSAVKCGLIDYSTNVTFLDCYIYDFGGGVFLINDCNSPSDQALISAEILFENCEVAQISDRDICYRGFMNIARSAGITVRHCNVHGGLHGAFFWERSSLLTFEHNEIYDFITGSDDCGVFYNYQTGETNIGIVGRYNYIHDIGRNWIMGHPRVFYDDGYSTSYSLYGNFITDIYQARDEYPFRVLGKMKINEVYGNIIADVGDGVSFGANHGGSEQGGSHMVASTMWRDMYSFESRANEDPTFTNQIRKFGLYNGAWDNSLAATDDGRNYTYKMWKRMLSEEYFYEIYGTPVMKISGLTIYADEDAYIQMTEDNVEEFAVIVKSGTEKGTHTFTKIADLFNFLYEKCGYNARNRVLPTTVELHYYGGSASDDLLVEQLYAPLFHNVDGKWEFSLAAAHNEITSMDKFWPTGKHFGDHVSDMATWQYWVEGSTVRPSVYHSNFTFNMRLDMTYNPEQYTNNMANKYNNYDYDLEGVKAVVDGEYTLDFIDIFTSIKDMGYLQDCELLDLSTVGCNLDRK